MKLREKLHAIMAEVNFIEKDKTNEHFNYEYASEQAIKEALHPQLVKHKVLFAMDVTDVHKEGSITTIRVVYTFTDVETGEEITRTFAGCGADNQDKGLYKAITGAIKYILTTTFLIPTGDDAEKDGEAGNSSRPSNRQKRPATPRQEPDKGNVLPKPQSSSTVAGRWQDKPISEPQQRRFRSIASHNGWNEDEVKRLLTDTTGSEHVSEIKRGIYDELCEVLERGR